MIKKVFLFFIISFLAINNLKANDLFCVKDLYVNEEGASSSEAKSEGIRKAKEEATYQILKKLVHPNYENRIDYVSENSINSLVKSMRIHDEKVSAQKYRARVDICLSPANTKKYFENKNIKYITNISDTVLLVPAYKNYGDIRIWDLNPYKEALENKDSSNYLVPFVVPYGGGEEYSTLTPYNLNIGDPAIFRNMYSKYDVDTIIYAVFEDNGYSKAKVTLNYIGEGDRQTVSFSDEGYKGIFKIAADKTLELMQNIWKSKQNSKQNISVVVPINHISDIINFEENMVSISSISAASMSAVAKDKIQADILYRTDISKVKRDLESYGYTVFDKGDYWILRRH
jgi:hypothetical protein